MTSPGETTRSAADASGPFAVLRINFDRCAPSKASRKATTPLAFAMALASSGFMRRPPPGERQKFGMQAAIEQLAVQVRGVASPSRIRVGDDGHGVYEFGNSVGEGGKPVSAPGCPHTEPRRFVHTQPVLYSLCDCHAEEIIRRCQADRKAGTPLAYDQLGALHLGFAAAVRP